MWHIGDAGGKKNFSNLTGAGRCAFQLGFFDPDTVHSDPGPG
jgi:hypothetical protein